MKLTLKKAEALLKKLEGAPAEQVFNILGTQLKVKGTGSRPQLYREIAKLIHPDRVGAEVKQAAKEIMQILNSAYQALSNSSTKRTIDPRIFELSFETGRW